MKPTLESVEALELSASQEKKRVELCIKHNICPECGLKLVLKEIRESYIDDFSSFWGRKKEVFYMAQYTVCEKDISHYKQIVINDCDDLDEF